MGIYLNPDNTAFRRALNSEIYVDKSMLLAFTNKKIFTENQNICVSRPRRFGKSMAENMLVAYYSRGCDSRELFSSLKISKDPGFEKHLNKYNVIHVNMVNYLSESNGMDEMLSFLQEDLTDEIFREFKDVEMLWSIGYAKSPVGDGPMRGARPLRGPAYRRNSLVKACAAVYAAKKIPFIFIIDEWDSVFRVHQNDKEAQKKYLDFLRGLLKDQTYVSLAYMTGILPVKKYGEHSALNMFDEYSMTNQRELAEFTGFTEEEVQELCKRYDMSYAETRKWYDGYDLKGVSVYNPRSVVMSMLGRDYDSYWTKTETYEALKIYIKMNQFGLKDIATRLIAGEHVPVNTRKFQNDMVTFESADDVLTLLIHLGYLTYDFYTETVRIPNSEVQQEFINSIEDGGWEPVMNAIRQSEKLLEATVNGRADEVAEAIEKIHEENASVLKYNDENSLANTLALAYYTARRKYDIYREFVAGKGFADLVFIPRRDTSAPAVVAELKWDKSTEAAIAQIHEKNYMECLKSYKGEVILAGINYDKETKKHSCKIEKTVK